MGHTNFLILHLKICSSSLSLLYNGHTKNFKTLFLIPLFHLPALPKSPTDLLFTVLSKIYSISDYIFSSSKTTKFIQDNVVVSHPELYTISPDSLCHPNTQLITIEGEMTLHKINLISSLCLANTIQWLPSACRIKYKQFHCLTKLYQTWPFLYHFI